MKPIDRALLARAKSHLKLAEIAQEIYITDENCYASDLDSLRLEDPALPNGIEITESSCRGYTIEVEAHDSAGHVVSLEKDWGRSEYHSIPRQASG